jgi:Ca2+-binding RTX toxin-like protein
VGTATAKTIIGSKRPDLLRGSNGRDVIRGLKGADRLFGHRGDDRLEGNSGPDLLVGGPGRDVLLGGPGNDRINAKDGQRDVISCGPGRDTVRRDAVDLVALDCGSANPPPVQAPRPDRTILLENQPWVCLGRVDLDLVKVTMRTGTDDAVRLLRNCSGRIGRIEVDTWAHDGIKIGRGAHDIVVQSGYVNCRGISPGAHQDGVQVMSGERITLRNVSIRCGNNGTNAQFFVTQGIPSDPPPVDVVCVKCLFGGGAGASLFVGVSTRSGARRTIICTGRFRAIRVDPGAERVVNVGNKVLPRNHPACADVSGLRRGN